MNTLKSSSLSLSDRQSSATTLREGKSGSGSLDSRRGDRLEGSGAQELASLIVVAILLATALWCHGGPPPGSFDDGAGITNFVMAVRPELQIERSEDADYDPPEPGSYTLPVVMNAADGQVLDSSGRLRTLREMTQGHISLLSFIYLRCSSGNACPRATGMLRQVHWLSEQDPVLATNLRLITMSFDPAHDTPERMKDYASLYESDKPGADWLFLTTPSERELAPILTDYGQVVDRRGNPNDPLGPFYHPVRIYLIDRRGRVRNIYSFGMLDPRLVVTDVRTLLLEDQATVASR